MQTKSSLERIGLVNEPQIDAREGSRAAKSRDQAMEESASACLTRDAHASYKGVCSNNLRCRSARKHCQEDL